MKTNDAQIEIENKQEEKEKKKNQHQEGKKTEDSVCGVLSALKRTPSMLSLSLSHCPVVASFSVDIGSCKTQNTTTCINFSFIFNAICSFYEGVIILVINIHDYGHDHHHRHLRHQYPIITIVTAPRTRGVRFLHSVVVELHFFVQVALCIVSVSL